jgi:hypothetical protein
MAISQNGSPEKLAVEAGVHAAHAAHDYVKQDGAIDQGKVRERIFEVLRASKVLDKKERAAKAITHGAMVEHVFPNLPGPDSFSEQPDPQLAQAIWEKIDANLWSMMATSASSALQGLVGLQMGNGYILCRTSVGKDKTKAVYITDHLGCIEEDFILPDNQSLGRKIRLVERNREMLVYRQPQNAKRFQREFGSALKQLTAASTGQLALAVEAVSADGEAPSDSDEG